MASERNDPTLSQHDQEILDRIFSQGTGERPLPRWVLPTLRGTDGRQNLLELAVEERQIRTGRL